MKEIEENHRKLTLLRNLEQQVLELKSNLFLSAATTNLKAKTLSCIAISKKYMTTVDILLCLLGSEAYYRLGEKERKSEVANLSVTLSNLAKEGRIKKKKLNGLKGNFYGMAEWFDEYGNMRPEYADSTIFYMVQSENQMKSCCE